MTEISNDNSQYLDDAVQKGTYSDRSEALNQAVDLLKKRDELRAEVQAGIDQADLGVLLPANKVFDRLEERAQQIEEAARQKQ